MCEMTNTVPKNIHCNIVLRGRNYKQPVCTSVGNRFEDGKLHSHKRGRKQKKKREEMLYVLIWKNSP